MYNILNNFINKICEPIKIFDINKTETKYLNPLKDTDFEVNTAWLDNFDDEYTNIQISSVSKTDYNIDFEYIYKTYIQNNYQNANWILWYNLMHHKKSIEYYYSINNDVKNICVLYKNLYKKLGNNKIKYINFIPINKANGL